MSDELRLLIGFLILAAATYLLVRTGAWQAFVQRPTARCNDGSVSFSEHRCGTCSHHGGVLEFLQV